MHLDSMGIRLPSRGTDMLFIILVIFASASSQVLDKISAMTFLGNITTSPDHIRHLSSLKYSKVLNSLPLLRESGKTVVHDDTVMDSLDADIDDGIPGLGGSVMARPPNYNVSERCLNDTMLYLEALLHRQPWALAMLDAAGKLPSGVLLGNIVWRGSYEQCVNVTAVLYDNITAKTNPKYPFRGRYCRLTALINDPNATAPPAAAGINGLFTGSPGLVIGLCLPDSCQGEDAVGLVNSGLSLIPVKLPPVPLFGDCSEVQDISTDTRAIVVIVLTAIFGAFLILGTGYDIIRYQVPAYLASLPVDEGKGLINGYTTVNRRESDIQGPYSPTEKTTLLGQDEGQAEVPHSGKLEALLLAFSVYSNGKKLLGTSRGQGTLGAVHGVRFLSMTWVILGHTYVFGLTAGDNVGSFLPEMVSRFTFQGILNATVSVDSFFLLSGLLLAYLTLKEMDKRQGKLNWGLFYFHRFWRLTPPYMLVMMVYVPLFKYWGSGPQWPVNGIEPNYCEESWWTNLLYINNLVQVEKMCMGWSWYLANDMQFFIITPIILIPLYYSAVIGMVIIGALLIATFIATGILSHNYGAGAGLIAAGNVNNYFLYIYIKPWCRIGPYLIGLLVGYALYRTRCRLRLNPVVVLAGWVCATVICLSVLYGLYDTEAHGVKVLSPDVSALYNATSRTAWGVGLGWLVFACCTGYGGFVNTILSWSALIPLSRLTYCAYLVHPIVMYLYYGSLNTPVHFTDLNVVYLFFGHLVLAYLTSFVVSLAFESPMMALERVVFRREKKS
ncbi:nose resistant to fluoxetine protein 6-like [Liolophura sinensis]|uniref:nose resistant to fluoxetine protein 6-like n=1 Tax=Liolophura sinensis TaxID=3198878 RepID=UPI003158530C